MTNKDKSSDGDIDMDQNTPIDLKGSEQHHKLKNQSGEKGDPNHAEGGGDLSEELSSSVKDAVADIDDETTVSSAFKKAVKD